jgi:DNA-binding transcriptional regulator YdaS (Cro superfamily)
MNLDSWLNEKRGRATEMANHFGVTLGAVSQWRTGGVPVDRMKAVQAFTGGAVTLDEMVPGVPAAPEAAPPVAEPAHAPGVNDRRTDRRATTRRKAERRGPDRREA